MRRMYLCNDCPWQGEVGCDHNNVAHGQFVRVWAGRIRCEEFYDPYPPEDEEEKTNNERD